MKEEGRKEEEGGKEGKKEGYIRYSTNVCMYRKMRKYIQRERINSREEIKNKKEKIKMKTNKQ